MNWLKETMVYSLVNIAGGCLRAVSILDLYAQSRIDHQLSDTSRASNTIKSWHHQNTTSTISSIDKIKQLTKEEVIFHLPYMAHSAYAHKPLSEMIEPFGYRPVDPKSIGIILSKLPGNIEILEGSIFNEKTNQWQATEKCFVDRHTGLKILISCNPMTKEIVLAFGDANSLIQELKERSKGAQINQYKGIVGNLAGVGPELYKQANFLSNQIMKTLSNNSLYNDYSFILAGQSLGGSLAQFVGLCNETKSLCYNAVPLGVTLQLLIGNERLKKANLYITHVTIESDYVSKIAEINFLLRNFGQHYSIPSAYTDMQKTHSFVLGSAMKYLEHNERTLPKSLEKTNPELLIPNFKEKLQEGVAQGHCKELVVLCECYEPSIKGLFDHFIQNFDVVNEFLENRDEELKRDKLLLDELEIKAKKDYLLKRDLEAIEALEEAIKWGGFLFPNQPMYHNIDFLKWVISLRVQRQLAG